MIFYIVQPSRPRGLLPSGWQHSVSPLFLWAFSAQNLSLLDFFSVSGAPYDWDTSSCSTYSISTDLKHTLLLISSAVSRTCLSLLTIVYSHSLFFVLVVVCPRWHCFSHTHCYFHGNTLVNGSWTQIQLLLEVWQVNMISVWIDRSKLKRQ